MSRQQLLEEKLRKSDVLTEEGVFADFMQYASAVRDEMEVYLYMEENQIGIDHADYWIARFNILQKQCEFVQLAALIRKVKAVEGLQQKWKIEQFEKQVTNLMEKLLFSKFRGKRKSNEFMGMDPSRVYEERRKIGNIQIYIDESCRMNYKLQDYSKFIEEKLKDHCTIERESYKRDQRRKEPSFIAKKEMDFIEMTQQIFAQTNRRSRGSFCAPAPRLSTKNRTSQAQRYQDETFNTPKNNQNKPEANRRMSIFQDNKQKAKGNVSRDSVEILKSIKKDKQNEEYIISPRFKDTPRVVGHIEEQPEATQVCRASQVIERNPFTAFSFGKNTRLIFQQKKLECQIKISELEPPILDDNAFLFHSFGQDNQLNQKNENSINKDDFELDLIIHQIQRETYDLADSKTFSSEIDSNQENKDYIELGIPTRQADYNRVRKPFEVLHETEPDNRHYELEELVHLDEDERNPESKGYETDLDNFKSNHKKSVFRQSIFRSQRQKRLSNISEEGSCYYSETKHVRSH